MSAPSVQAVELAGRHVGIVARSSDGGWVGSVRHPRCGVIVLRECFHDDLVAADAVRQAWQAIDAKPAPAAVPIEVDREVLELDLDVRHARRTGLGPAAVDEWRGQVQTNRNGDSMVTEKRLLRIYPDLAARLGCSRSKAYEVAREIGVVRIGGRAARVPSGALDRWLEAREQEAIEAATPHRFTSFGEE